MALFVLSFTLPLGAFEEPVAAADTETGASVSDAQHVGDTGSKTDEVGKAKEPESTVGTVTVGTGVADKIQELTAKLDTGSPSSPAPSGDAQTGQQTIGPAGPMVIGVSALTEPGVTTSAEGTTAPVVDENSPTLVTAQQNTGAVVFDDESKGSDSTAATTADEVNKPTVAISSSPTTEPSPVAQAPDTGVNPPADNPPAEDSNVVQPVTHEAASVEATTAPAQAAPAPAPPAAPLVGAAATVSNVIAALTYFLLPLTGNSTVFINVSNGLLSLLGLPPMSYRDIAPLAAAGELGGSLSAGSPYSAASTQSALSQAIPSGWPELLIGSGNRVALSSAGAVVHRSLGGLSASGVAEHPAAGLKAVLADGVVPEQVRSVLQHTVDALLAPLSWLALAALASPGVAGLLLLGAAGTFVGYRQARAASMLRAVGLARFAQSGPLGIVRSVDLIAVHPRRPQAVRRQPSRTRGRLEPVA